MTEGSAIFQNMSAPSKTTIRYSGLAELVGGRDPVSVSKSQAACNRKNIGLSRPILFRLRQGVRSSIPEKLLSAISPDTVTKNPEQEIMRLINERAAQLPLPDGVPLCPRSWSRSDLG